MSKLPLGPEKGPMIVAEISGNHNGSLPRALDIVRAIADTGAHAVKIQTYTADTITLNVDTPAFRISDGHELWGSRKLYDLYGDYTLVWWVGVGVGAFSALIHLPVREAPSAALPRGTAAAA